MTIEGIEPDLRGADLRIGVVQARFNLPICEALRDACLSELKTLGVATEDILLATVPGALEVPLMLQKMAESEQFDALIAIGAVIRGETYHFEMVANESASGITHVGLKFAIPVANAILTTDTEAQAEARADEKGADAARVAVEMANLASTLESLADDASDDS